MNQTPDCHIVDMLSQTRDGRYYNCIILIKGGFFRSKFKGGQPVRKP